VVRGAHSWSRKRAVAGRRPGGEKTDRPGASSCWSWWGEDRPARRLLLLILVGKSSSAPVGEEGPRPEVLPWTHDWGRPASPSATSVAPNSSFFFLDLFQFMVGAHMLL
jgi:hypothetical protein